MSNKILILKNFNYIIYLIFNKNFNYLYKTKDQI